MNTSRTFNMQFMLLTLIILGAAITTTAMASNHHHDHHDHHAHHKHSHEDKDPGEMYSQEWVQELVAKIQGFIGSNVTWLGLGLSTNERVLDYACGHGTITLALVRDHLTAIFRGIDSHPKQVERYNDEAFKLFGDERNRMYAVQGDLDNPSSELDQAAWSNFDVAIISMALHHVPEPVKMLSQLRQRLKIGGSLVVVEWYEESDRPEEMTGSDNLDRDDVIVVNGGEQIWAGFSPLGLSGLLKQAGFVDLDVRKPGISFVIPQSVGGPMSGVDKKLMFVKGVNGAASAL